MNIQRHSWFHSASLTDDIATTPAIPCQGAEYGTVYIPSGSSITTLTYHAAPDPEDTFVALHNSSGAVTQTVAAGEAHPLPPEFQGCRALKIVVNAAGSVQLSFK